MKSDFKAVWTRANAKLKSLFPAVQQLCLSELDLPEDDCNPIFSQLFDTLIKFADLLKRCENISPLNFFLSYTYTSQILDLEKEIQGFIDLMPAHSFLENRRLKQELQGHYDALRPADPVSSPLNESVCRQASILTDNAFRNGILLQQMRIDQSCDNCEMDEGFNHSVHDNFPVKSPFYVGMEKPIRDLKRLLFQNEVSTVGVQCIPGGGKTTLALALCDDDDVKGYFRNVAFVSVSESPNMKVIIETMWDKLVGIRMPQFQNVEDAHRQLQQRLLSGSGSTLVILDDVWCRQSLEKLLFEGPGLKTLVTTRDSSTIPRNHFTRLYQLPLLGDEDALSLFCFWAFGQTSIPTNEDANLVKEVQAECGRLPLVLKVIGSCLNGEPPASWQIARIRLSDGESTPDYHRDGLLRRLETSVNFLDDVARECFLDLGAFPADRKICADVLLDIWVYVRKLEWNNAFTILWELNSRNLMNLTSNPRSPAAISHRTRSDLYFSQQNVMRELAIYLGGECSELKFPKWKRLLMPKKENNLPGIWEFLKNRASDAQIVSIHTGQIGENEWHEIDFPETEALVLCFDAREYFLPPFIKDMKDLKVFMLCNYGPNRAIMKGLDALSSLPQLRSVRLEGLLEPNILKQSKAVQNLEKLSLSLCEGFGSLSTINCSKLQDFNLDHCSDLEELPVDMCIMPSAVTWSITNCHLLQKLPDDLGNLASLRMLRLSALPGLKELPSSIGKLCQLEYLDISLCEGLQKLPNGIGQLQELKEIDMRKCSRLKELPRSVCGSRSLKHVICDKEIERQWLWVKKNSIPELKVEVVEAQVCSDWLDD